MYASGHYGMALLVYAPVGAVALATGHDSVALIGWAGTLALAKLPDVDRDLVLVSHRGVTHTLAFGLAVALALAGIAVAVAGGNPADAPVTVALGFAIGGLAVGSHLLADVLTPSGVPLLWPLSSRSYTLNVARADSVVANYLLLALGIAATVAVLFGTAAIR
jgi:inner membrane protein